MDLTPLCGEVRSERPAPRADDASDTGAGALSGRLSGRSARPSDAPDEESSAGSGGVAR